MDHLLVTLNGRNPMPARVLDLRTEEGQTLNVWRDVKGIVHVELVGSPLNVQDPDDGRVQVVCPCATMQDLGDGIISVSIFEPN